MSPAASLTRSELGDLTWIAVEGELDAGTAQIIGLELSALCEGRPHVVIDARPLRFIDLAGLRMLVAVERRRREQGGRVSLVYGRLVQRLAQAGELEYVVPPPEPPGRLLGLYLTPAPPPAREGLREDLRQRVHGACVRQRELVDRMAALRSRAVAAAQVSRETVALVAAWRPES